MLRFSSVLALSALAISTGYAQQGHSPHADEWTVNIHPGGAPGMVEARIMGGAGFDRQVVKGAPYSAVAVTETTQVLANGTRISRKTTTALARDSQGRTRREENLSTVGPWSTDAAAHSVIFINDPVNQAHYVLDPSQHSANKMAAPRVMVRRKEPSGDGSAAQARSKQLTDALEQHRSPQQANVKTESLGTQTISGVVAQGTRHTRTIPVGQIGNDQPIDIVSESWYSPELQMVVMSKHSDPRSGDTVYTLTNLQRSEPDASLFTVPADFTVQENSAHRFVRKGPVQ